MHIQTALPLRSVRKFSCLVSLALGTALLPVVALTAPAGAASGDFSLNLVAAAPYSYDHLHGGGAFDDGTKGKQADIVESLEASDFSCGDTVTYLTQVSVDDTAQAGTDGPQTIEIDYRFLMDTTGQTGAAIGDITRVGVNYAPVVDTIPGEDTVDQGISDDGGSTATLVSETRSGPMFTAGSVLNGTVRVTDLERAEKVVVRVDVRLFCQPGSNPTGNLQGAISGARLTSVNGSVPVSPPTSINVGNQTVPFLQLGGLHFPELVIEKTVTTANGTCPGTESLDIQSGDTVKYCYRVTNPSNTTDPPGAALYDLSSVTDDNRTPANPSDDFTVALTGLTDVDGDGQSDDLVAGGQAFGEKPVQISAGQAGTYTNTAVVKGYAFPDDTSLPFTVSDTASVNVTVSASAAINVSKTPGTVSGPDAQGDYTVTYMVTVTNGGTAAGTYGPIIDTPQFDPNMQPTSLSWKLASSSSWTVDSAAPYLVGTGGTAIPAGATDTYAVMVTFDYSGATAASACNGTAGGGLYNNVTLPAGQEHGTLTDNDACVEPPPPVVPGEASVSIEKSVDLAQAAPGDTVTYMLVVRNTGTAAASDVTVTDALPSGVTFVSATAPCGQAGGIVTCDLGTVGAGDVVTLLIKVTVDPVAAGDTSHQHQLDFAKQESNVSLSAGDTSTTSVSCPTGYFATDGSVRLDNVDQGAGTFADAEVLASKVTSDGKGWTGTVRNDTTGQLQAKVNVVCMTEKTTSGDDHSHPVVVSDPVVETTTLAAGRHDVDLSCAADSYAIDPSFEFTSGEGTVSTRRTATGWTFIVDTDAPAAATFSIRCLSTMLGTTNGHNHELVFSQLSDTVTVPAGGIEERKLTCPDGYKGIVAWNDMDPGLVSLGNDPQPISRVFRWFNPTGSAFTARYGLLCVAIRTNGGSGDPGPVVNTASVDTSSVDATTADDQSSAAFLVNTTGIAIITPKASVVSQAGQTRVVLSVRSAGKRNATFKLVAIHRVAGTAIRPGSLLAQTRDSLSKGRTTVRMSAEGAAATALEHGKVTYAKVVVTLRNGDRAVWIVKIRR